ncbi:putative altered inheritance of mitochondria protein [Clavispora lusitaniae]|uniref:Altered inheritance of mitochondria protein n=1 Tax=Clavispora lusitaniae TaxID=36911 RepID=A0AA91T015_CLALS|nr:putative altered inheritance of mitochondria protein [Clavispora lusitaniae]
MFRLVAGKRPPVRTVLSRGIPCPYFAKAFYSTPQRKIRKPEEGPKIRYLVLVVFASFGLLHFVTTQVDKKAPKNSFTEREFEQYERETGLRRRHKLINHEKNDQYAFYAVPYAHDVSKAVQLLTKMLPNEKQVKVIDPKQLIEKELEDEGKYSYLLQDLLAYKKPLPRGLITALMKQEIELFLNTTKGQFDTNILLMNYPQSTDEAIKFENDVSELKTCIVLEDDFAKSLHDDLSDDDVRKVNNVVGYFDTVGKAEKVNSKVKVLN